MAAAIAAAIYARRAAVATEETVGIAREASVGAQAALATAERNANAADKQVKVSEQTAKAQLRAYVGIDEIRVRQLINGYIGNPTYEVKVTLKNYGQTPAWVTFDAKAIISTEQPTRATVPRPGGAPQFLQPNATVSDRFPIERVGPMGKQCFFVIATFEYIDIYGAQHGHRRDYSSLGTDNGEQQLKCIHEEQSVHSPPLKWQRRTRSK